MVKTSCRTLAARAGQLCTATMILAAGNTALAQVCTSTGPDATIGILGPTVANYAAVGGIDAFSVNTTLCNLGDVPLQFNGNTNAHPIVTQNLYRFKVIGGAGRFEQVGMGWCFNTFFALSQNACCTTCTPGTTSELGANCSSVESATVMGTTSALSPRHQVNPVTGAFAFPGANPALPDALGRRLRVASSDLDPAQNGGGRYFVEHIVVSSHDAAAGNSLNNASYREASISGTGGNWNMSIMGTAQAMVPAVFAWAAAESGVTIVAVDVPGDGRYFVAAKATEVSPGMWRYEYAVENLNSDRAARLFAVPMGSGSVASAIGFHDVSYHSGDGPGNINFDGTNWTSTSSNGVVWSTQRFEDNASANALRWGTLYNFRFDSTAAPAMGAVQIGLFKPGAVESVSAVGLPVPGSVECAGDWNQSGTLDSQDYFDFLAAFFAGEADFNGDLTTNSQDFFDFLGAFFEGC